MERVVGELEVEQRRLALLALAGGWKHVVGVPGGLGHRDQGLGPLDCDYNAAGTAVATGDRACDASPGYDGPTGVGTPMNLTVFAKTGPAVTVSGPATIAHGSSGTWMATVTDPFPGGHPATYTFNWGDGTANTVVTSTALTSSQSHTYTAAGSKTITVTVNDNYNQSGSKTFPVTVS
jgi:hypothetical protein